ncbi:ABC transporter permease [Micromonospora deserti]|uniref:ABC transporter permease n=1 Tax=Micromonospora deserti TaxID=2070366 RepID=A0A2W2CW21_9ACTN|nr:ABC transporter permease [Micromonospora deserti]PZG02713.1 ABC transporter permease [Micromonospora deserti]
MRRLIAGEIHKLLATRLWLWLLLAAMAITALYASLQIAFSDDPDTWTPPLTTPDGQQTLFAAAASAASPLVAVLAAIGITGEYRHRTATTTFLSTPRRGRVIAAKLVTYGLVGIGYALACTAVVTAIAVPWLSARGIELSLTGNGLPATTAGGIIAIAFYAVIGVGLGALLREQVATVVGLLIYLFVLEPILTSIPALDTWSRYLPGPADNALTGITLTNQESLQPWQGGLVLAAYGLTIAAAGTYLATRRDVA